jgi:uncharacterized protein YcbK (DUF882 family)
MGKSSLDAGHRQTLTKRLKKALINSALAATMAAGSFAMLESPAFSGGETRSISLYHIHTGERLTVTYMQNGHYVPSAMKQINYLLRDWRKNKVVTIDPRSIDLVWELHEDLGSHGIINIVCGYRSASTNAMLHRIGRKVANHSQHINGKAIDFYFPDVPTVKIRNSALVRKVGGVGYYRSAGGPTGFLHVDSGSVRHWGPYISNSQMAQIQRDGAKTVGRRMRLNGGNDSGFSQVAEAAPPRGEGIFGLIFGKKKPVEQPAPQVAVAAPIPTPVAVEKAYTGSQDDLADLTADAAVAPAPKVKPVIIPPAPSVPKEQIAALNAMAREAAKAPTPVVEETADNGAAEPLVKQGYPIPRPRLKPVEIMLMAAANMKTDPKLVRITPVRDTPLNQDGTSQPSPVSDSLGTVMALAAEEPVVKAPKSNKKSKTDFATELRNGTTEDAPVIKPLLASAGGSDINWWPQLLLNGEATIRRDGAPSVIGAAEASSLPMAAKLNADGSEASGSQTNEDGKGDLLTVVRDGKGDLEGPVVLDGKPQKLSSN